QSDPVELVVTDHSLATPGIFLSSEGHVETGTNVTIRCWCNCVATFSLHKDGRSSPIQHQDTNFGDKTFILFGVTPKDTGTYRCSYRPNDRPYLSSPLGDKVTLEVTPLPAPP
ncbi:TARM1 protein, partial [Alectura lathami]|nr:TARM1 protein [Alectura lathami]